MTPTPLSNADLSLFFADHHHALAEKLAEAHERLVAASAAGDRACAHIMGELGLYGWLVPDGAAPVPEISGAKRSVEGTSTIDVRALVLIREWLGYYSPLGDAIFAVQGLGSYPVTLAGSSDQQQALLPRFRSGDAIGAFALTEPEAGSDVASMRTTARRDGGEFVLDGEKTLISNVGIATHYVVFANADPAAGRKGISAFLVDAAAAGLHAETIAMGIEHPIGALRFEGCRVPESALLGEIGGGFRLAMQTLDTFRVSVGAAAVGMARRAYDEAIAHVSRRVQFGKPLAEQQLVQGYLAEMATELDAARLLVLRAAYEKDRERARVTTEAAKAKLYATEAAQRIIDLAVQLHGGRGVTSGAVVENLYRAIRPLRIYEGTSEIQKLIIGRAVVKERAEGLRD